MIAMKYLPDQSTPAELWEVGRSWVRFEDGKYTIGVGDSATWTQVQELLIESNWQAQRWLLTDLQGVLIEVS